MDRNNKTLLAEIKSLLRGPVPELRMAYFEGEYFLSETFKGDVSHEIIDPDRAKEILNENPDLKVSFVYLSQNDPPVEITDEHEIFEWQRANPVKPEIPEEIAGRLLINIGITNLRIGKDIVEMFLGLREL